MSRFLLTETDRSRAADLLIRQLAELMASEGRGDPALLKARLEAVLRQSVGDCPAPSAAKHALVSVTTLSLEDYLPLIDRKRGVVGKKGSVGGDFGGRRIFKYKKKVYRMTNNVMH